jgi:hypothetical protein
MRCLSRSVVGHLGTSCRSAIAGCVVLLAASFAQAQTDGWGLDGGPGSPTYGNSTTIGVTLGTQSLKATTAQGGFWGPSTPNLLNATHALGGSHLSDLQSATTLEFDLTLINAELNGGTPGFAGFAQSNELSLSVFDSGGGTLPAAGVNQFIQKNFVAGGATDSLNQSGGWNGVDGTRHITWDLTKFTLTDPSDSVVKTVAAFLTAHPDTDAVGINFVEQMGSGLAPGSMYWDNVRLTGGGRNGLIGNFEPVPEPTTLALAVIALPAAFVFARRRTLCGIDESTRLVT